MPLLSMSNSCLLCISTLLTSGNHYSKMFELRDELGKPLFETISISLVCDDCMKTEHPEAYVGIFNPRIKAARLTKPFRVRRCTHKLAEMPRWLSSKKLEVVKQLLADDPAMLLRESMGVGSDSTQRAFSSTDITSFFARATTSLDGMYSYNRAPPVLVAVDPAGGGASAFAVASCVQLTTGGLMVRASPPSPYTHTLKPYLPHACAANCPRAHPATFP